MGTKSRAARVFLLAALAATNSQAIESERVHPAYELGVKLAECKAFYDLASDQFAAMGNTGAADDLRQASRGAGITSQVAFMKYSSLQESAQVDHEQLMQTISASQRQRLDMLHDKGGFPAISDEAYSCNSLEMIQNRILEQIQRQLVKN